MNTPNPEEREMTNHQRSLVNNCFEEGQYESGMAVLDQLRSPSFIPPPDHVRQLIYIALFPPLPLPGDQTHSHQQQLPPSPTKQKPGLSKASLSPSVPESFSAQRVLFSFLATNTPASLFRALPRYPLDGAAANELPPQPSDNGHDEDSLVARESLCLKNCKNCWAILKDGFIQRKLLLPQDPRKKRTRGTYDLQDPALDQGHDTPTVVAEHAWPILQWLLALFEKDELLRFQNSGDKLSLLLLSQIPPPRGGNGPRWEAGAPLDIIFHSIDQQDRARREMATQLLTLLINLGLSESFDGPMFAAALTTRLYTSSAQIIRDLMESLPKTVPVLAFKMLVCQKFLSSSSSIAGGTKPRPRPLARHESRRDSGTISATDIDTARTAPSLSLRTALVTSSEVLQLLCGDHGPQPLASESPVLAIKYVLLVSYAQLQGSLPSGERDAEWKDALSNGRVRRVIDTVFPSNSAYHTALTIVVSFWPAG